MNFELTMARLEEMVLCIIHNELNEDEAIKYMKGFVLEINTTN